MYSDFNVCILDDIERLLDQDQDQDQDQGQSRRQGEGQDQGQSIAPDNAKVGTVDVNRENKGADASEIEATSRCGDSVYFFSVTPTPSPTPSVSSAIMPDSIDEQVDYVLHKICTSAMNELKKVRATNRENKLQRDRYRACISRIEADIDATEKKIQRDEEYMLSLIQFLRDS